MSAAGYKDVWIVGGGDAAAQFVDAGLVDELVVTYAPCTLGSGGRLLPTASEWSLIESGVNRDFVCARWRKATTGTTGVVGRFPLRNSENSAPIAHQSHIRAGDRGYTDPQG